MTVYFEDIEIGAVMEGGAYAFDAESIVGFASRHDPRPFHVDAAAAARTRFGGLIASGIHTLTAWCEIWNELTPDHAIVAGADFQEMRFRRPVRPGDTVGLWAQYTRKLRNPLDPAEGFVEMRHEVRNQNGEAVLQFTTRFVMTRRPAS